MPNTFYIIEVDKTIPEYTEKLVTQIKAQDIDVTYCSLDDYNNAASLADIVFQGAKLIFMGNNPKGQPAVQNISVWQYERFGCRIGFAGNKCVIYARDADLPYSDYKDFRDYCKSLHLEDPDVVVPPENPVAEGVEWMKKKFADKNNRSVHRAQYSALIHEFMNHHLVEFISSVDDGEESANAEVPSDLKTILRNLKAATFANLTTKQAIWCHTIIHTTALSCAAVAFIPIPVADTFPITAAQISMVVSLGVVFGNKLSKSDAQILLKTIAAPVAGRTLAKVGLVLIPGVGWTINGAISGAITEILGWTIANDFANKIQ